MTIATQLRENHSHLNWILIQKLPCPLLVAEMKLPNNVSVVKSLHLHQFELTEENEMHSIFKKMLQMRMRLNSITSMRETKSMAMTYAA